MRVVGLVMVGMEGRLCRRVWGGQCMGQVWVRCRESRGFKERWVWSRQTAKHWGASKPDKISEDVPPLPASRNYGSALLEENCSLEPLNNCPWPLFPLRAQA